MKIKTFIFSLLACLANQFVLAQDCLTEWGYYRSLNIENTSADLLTDIQARVDLDVGALIAAGKLNPDLSDLRILDTACNPVYFYIDSALTDSIRPVWIKVPQLAANTTWPLELYYGNATAPSVINGDSTFLFFDDFEASEVNLNKWEPIGEYENFGINNGVFEYSSTGSTAGSRFKFVRTAMSFEEKVHFDFNATVSNSNGFGFSSTDTILERILFRISGAFGFDTLNQVAYNTDTISNGFATTLAYPFIRYPRGQATDATITAEIESQRLEVSYFANLTDSSATDSLFRSPNFDMSGFHFILSSFSGFATVSLDYLRVRKFLADSLMPTSVIGDEVMLTVSSLEPAAFSHPLMLAPNPVQAQLSIKGLPTGTTTLEWLTVQGQVVATETLRAVSGTTHTVEVPRLSPGLYWVRFQNETSFLYAQSILVQ